MPLSFLLVLLRPQGVPAVEAVMVGVAANNDPPLPPEHVRGFANASDIDAYLLAHPETVGLHSFLNNFIFLYFHVIFISFHFILFLLMCLFRGWEGGLPR